jgi:hypothetical protein
MSKPSKTDKTVAPTGGGKSQDKQQDKRALDRRTFFMMGGSAVAAVAVVPFAGEAEAAAESVSEAKKARYKETEHVKNYYRVNRY